MPAGISSNSGNGRPVVGLVVTQDRPVFHILRESYAFILKRSDRRFLNQGERCSSLVPGREAGLLRHGKPGENRVSPIEAYPITLVALVVRWSWYIGAVVEW